MLCKFGECLAHVAYELRYEFAKEWLMHAEECIAISDCTAENTSYDIAGLDIGGQLSVGNREADSPDMVGNNPHCHSHFAVTLIFYSADPGNCINHGCEYIRVVVALFVLQYHAEALQSHSRIHMFGSERLE